MCDQPVAFDNAKACEEHNCLWNECPLSKTNAKCQPAELVERPSPQRTHLYYATVAGTDVHISIVITPADLERTVMNTSTRTRTGKATVGVTTRVIDATAIMIRTGVIDTRTCLRIVHTGNMQGLLAAV